MIRNNTSRCRIFGALLMITLISLLQSCVTTDELYAEYDSGACLLDVSGLTTTGQSHQVIEHNHPSWVPAVYFGSDKHELTSIAEFQLQTTLRVLKRYPQLLLGLQGYTDSRGSVAYNLALADRRIASVKQFLVNNGLNSSRIISQPLGVGLPRIGNSVDAAQATNRRVGLNALDISGRPVPLLFPSDDRQEGIDTLLKQPVRGKTPDEPARSIPARTSNPKPVGKIPPEQPTAGQPDVL